VRKPDDYIEIFLQPGDFYFGDASTRMRTLLGSCVALTMWHPGRLIGAMSHVMVPSRSDDRITDLDGRYADESLLMFFREAARVGTHPRDYQLKLFGGGNMFPGLSIREALLVGLRNVECVRETLAVHGLKVHSEHTGGSGHRTVMFDVWSGDVWLKHQPIEHERTRVNGGMR
jgi:chemotaxis protein CheD